MANRVLTNGKARLMTNIPDVVGTLLGSVTYGVLDTNNTTTINNYTTFSSPGSALIASWTRVSSVSSNQWFAASSTSPNVTAGSTVRSLLAGFNHAPSSQLGAITPLVCIDTNAAFAFVTNGGTVTVSWASDRIMTL